MKNLLIILSLFVAYSVNAQSVFKSMAYKSLPVDNSKPITFNNTAEPSLEEKLKAEMYKRKTYELYEKKLENDRMALEIQKQKNLQATGNNVYTIESFKTIQRSNGEFISSSFSQGSTLEIINDQYLKIEIPKLSIKELFILESQGEVDGMTVYTLNGNNNYLVYISADNSHMTLGLVLEKLKHDYILSVKY
ncbi:hypothetical protein [Sphingobacterium athyrii]|uniref:DUF4251 domain-containing protein n=1 Tax=Sphingobacterium athyrii TaxID=2152717 RepID=A0A363NUP2_9SPHI|nr:hypothetical protein [Sphingobacterium athyrii]PUV24536.1 hypothetical protein DCO56_14435 [Sphingobacterium athyrii]